MIRHRLMVAGWFCALGLVGCGHDSPSPADAEHADNPALPERPTADASPEVASPRADAGADTTLPGGPDASAALDAVVPGDLALLDAPTDLAVADTAAVERPGLETAVDLARADQAKTDAPPAEAGARDTGAEAGCTGWTTLLRLSPADAKTLIDSSDPIVINVHIPYEGDIPGTDVDIPYNNVDAIETYLGHDHCAEVLLVCLSGGMSQSAGNELIRRGYLRVRDISGGMTAWQAAGYPLLRDGGV